MGNGGCRRNQMQVPELVTREWFDAGQTVNTEPNLSRVAGSIGDATRVRMLALLLDGRALTAKELAHGSGVVPATASTHLKRLVLDGLLAMKAQGRHRYFALSSTRVADCIESLLALASPGARRAPAPRAEPIHEARFCYDHLAGRLGVELTRALLERGILRTRDRAFEVTRKGAPWFSELGVDLKAVAAVRRRFAYACLDWSERQDHLGGGLGAALAARFVTAGWVKRARESRAVFVTAAGERALSEHFGIEWNRETARELGRASAGGC
jgi:DNA-binding transcriptional ArsR family regulator